MVEFFFQGDRRTKFGKAVIAGSAEKNVSASRFYPLYIQGVEAGEFPHRSSSDELKRRAVKDGLERVRIIAAEIKCFVDLAHEEMLLDAP